MIYKIDTPQLKELRI